MGVKFGAFPSERFAKSTTIGKPFARASPTTTTAFAPHLYETTAELSSEHRFVTACSREDQQSLAHLSRCRDDRADQRAQNSRTW